MALHRNGLTRHTPGGLIAALRAAGYTIAGIFAEISIENRLAEPGVREPATLPNGASLPTVAGSPYPLRDCADALVCPGMSFVS